MKYVFVCPDIKFLTIQYRDFLYNEDTDLVSIGGARKIAKFLNHRLKLYKFKLLSLFLNLFFKSYFKRMKFNGSAEKICFVLYARTYEDFRTSIIRYLRKKYSGCVICVYFGDLMKRHLCDLDSVRKDVDYVFTFDDGEAKKFGVNYLLEPFSLSVGNMEELSDDSKYESFDISFVGHAKDRFQKIVDIYSVLKEKDIKCDMHISGVDKQYMKFKEDIKYGAIDFISLLMTVVNSKCILEIMQNNGISPTTRFAEAIVLKRYLLTDCVFFKNNKYPNVIYYEKLDDLKKMDFSFLRETPIVRDEDISLFSINNMVLSINKVIK